MELKDVILSTLAEIEEITVTAEAAEEQPAEPVAEQPAVPVMEEYPSYTYDRPEAVSVPMEVRDDEARMLEGIRERLLVLFEGFQSPNNVQIEAKVDLTLNFFEYLLATIDNRLETIKK